MALDAKTLSDRRWYREVLTALIDAQEALAMDVGGEAPASAEALKTEVRNRVLAGSGVKAQLLGTLGTKRTLAAADLMARGVPQDEALAVMEDADAARQAALALATAPPPELKEK